MPSVRESASLEPEVRRAIVSASMPTGSVTQFAGSTAPAGWLFCDGSAVRRTTYAALFAVIGTTFGAGDGSTTFNLPDTRGRAPIGAGTGSGLTARTLGGTVGTETHLLTGAESGTSVHNHTQNSHNHTQDSHNHTQNAHSHAAGGNANGTGFPYRLGGAGEWGPALDGGATSSDWWTLPGTTSATATNIATTATNQAATATNQATAAANASSAHPNMQPSLVFNFIIRT